METLGGWLTAGTMSARPEVLKFVGRVVRRLPLQRGGGERARTGDEADAVAVVAGPLVAPRRRGRGDRGALGRGVRVGRDGRLVVRRAPVARHRVDDHAFAGGLVGGGLPHHGHGHGRDPRPRAVAGFGRRSIRAGLEKRDGLQRRFHGALARPRGCSGTCRPSGDSPGIIRRSPRLLFGALAFPMVKTIIETFDGSQAFFRRVGKSYRNPTLYLRGAVVGLGPGVRDRAGDVGQGDAGAGLVRVLRRRSRRSRG